MKLERARELYSDYAEGGLSPAMRLTLEQHFAADPAARADYDEFARVFALLDTEETAMVDVPLGFRAKIMELAAEEQSQRQNAPVQRAAVTLTGWFHTLTHTQRRVTGGFAAALAACVVLAGVALHPNAGPSHSSSESGLGPNISLGSTSPTVIQGVSTRPGQDGNTYQMFDVHLPTNGSGATVSAYVVTATDEITDPAARQAHATPALKQPQHLDNDDDMQIPVALLQQAPVGTTLNLLVLWTPDSGAAPGAQIVFTPVGGAGTPNTPAGSGYFDALQAIAAQYQVTVIADAANPPVQAAPSFAQATTAQAALTAVAGPLGYGVRALPNGAYQVFKR